MDDPILIWAPDVISHVDKSDMELYLQFSSTPCIPGGGCNIEEALDTLYQANGDIKKAMQQLLKTDLINQAIWSFNEVLMFERLIMLHGKNFYSISKDLETKTVKECVQFYYIWKKSTFRNRLVSPTTPNYSNASVSSVTSSTYTTASVPSIVSPTNTNTTSTSTTTTTTTTTEIKPPTEATNLTATPSSSTSDESRDSGRGDSLLSIDEHNQQSLLLQQSEQQFPCKVCGRIFMKIKSRSAHMKRHKNERLYSNK